MPFAELSSDKRKAVRKLAGKRQLHDDEMIVASAMAWASAKRSVSGRLCTAALILGGSALSFIGPGWLPDLGWTEAIRDNHVAKKLMRIRRAQDWKPPEVPPTPESRPAQIELRLMVRAAELIERENRNNTTNARSRRRVDR